MFLKRFLLDRAFQDLSNGFLYFSVAQIFVDFVIFICLGILGILVDLKNGKTWNWLSLMFKAPLNVLYTCRVCKISRWTYIWFIIRKILTWRSQVLNIIMIRHKQVKLNHLKPLTLKHVEIIKVLDRPIYDTSFERSWLGGHRFWILLRSDIHRWNWTSQTTGMLYVDIILLCETELSMPTCPEWV